MSWLFGSLSNVMGFKDESSDDENTSAASNNYNAHSFSNPSPDKIHYSNSHPSKTNTNNNNNNSTSNSYKPHSPPRVVTPKKDKKSKKERKNTNNANNDQNTNGSTSSSTTNSVTNKSGFFKRPSLLSTVSAASITSDTSNSTAELNSNNNTNNNLMDFQGNISESTTLKNNNQDEVLPSFIQNTSSCQISSNAGIANNNSNVTNGDHNHDHHQHLPINNESGTSPSDYSYMVPKSQRIGSDSSIRSIAPSSSNLEDYSFSDFMWNILGYSKNHKDNDKTANTTITVDSPYRSLEGSPVIINKNSIHTKDQNPEIFFEATANITTSTSISTNSTNNTYTTRMTEPTITISSQSEIFKNLNINNNVQSKTSSSMNLLNPKSNLSSAHQDFLSWESLESARKGFSFDDLRPAIKFCNVPDDYKPLLEASMADKFRNHLSPIQRESIKWNFIYSIEKHGISMNTLYENCKDIGPTLWLIKDNHGNLFGAFMTDDIEIHNGYFGNGDCFLWKKLLNSDIEIYHATGKNDYLMLCEPHCIAIGGGEGHFGLWIDQELLNGHSTSCQTFDNEPLSSTSEFQIMELEIWSFAI